MWITGRLAWALSGLCLALLLWLGLQPGTGSPGNLRDKIHHIMGFAALGACLSRAQPRRRDASLVFVLALAVFVEAAQGLMNMGRTPSTLDAVASGFGGAIGLIVGAQASLATNLGGGLAIVALAFTFQAGTHQFRPEIQAMKSFYGKAIRPPASGEATPVAPGKLSANP